MAAVASIGPRFRRRSSGKFSRLSTGQALQSTGSTSQSCCCPPPCLPLDQMVVDLAGLTRKTGCINSIGFEPYYSRTSPHLNYLIISGAVPAGRYILPQVDANPTTITYYRAVQCSPVRTTAAFTCSDAESNCHTLQITVYLTLSSRTARVVVVNAGTVSPTRIPPYTSSETAPWSTIFFFEGSTTYPACWTSPVTAGNTLPTSGAEDRQPYIGATGGTAVIRPYQAGQVDSFNTDPTCGCPSSDEENPFP